jgi:hypothetical protein
MVVTAGGKGDGGNARWSLPGEREKILLLASNSISFYILEKPRKRGASGSSDLPFCSRSRPGKWEILPKERRNGIQQDRILPSGKKRFAQRTAKKKKGKSHE